MCASSTKALIGLKKAVAKSFADKISKCYFKISLEGLHHDFMFPISVHFIQSRHEMSQLLETTSSVYFSSTFLLMMSSLLMYLRGDSG